MKEKLNAKLSAIDYDLAELRERHQRSASQDIGHDGPRVANQRPRVQRGRLEALHLRPRRRDLRVGCGGLQGARVRVQGNARYNS